MKPYDETVKLNVLNMSLDSSYQKENYSDEELVEARWKKTESALKKAFPFIRKYYRQLFDEVRTMLKEIDFRYEDLNKIVPPIVKRRVEDKQEEWKKDASGFFLYLIKTHSWRYRDVLRLLIYGLYFEKFKKIREVSEDVFKVAAVDAYSQSIEDRGRTSFAKLSLAAIMAMAIMPVFQNSYNEYLEAVMMSQAEEMNAFINIHYMQDIEITDGETKIIIRQANRILKVNDDKYSGGLDDITRVIFNQGYTYDSDDDDDLKVRFVAVIDDRTTKMCRSLQNQIFFVNRSNTFQRYSDVAGGPITVTCDGLVAGLNLPPINDHFHWCRSTITYV